MGGLLMNNNDDRAAIIEQLNAMRQRQIDSTNIKKQLSQQRQNEMETGSPEEQSGWGGVWSDIKGIGRQIPHALGEAALAAPHALYQAGEQMATLPYETGKFAYKTAKEGYKPENLPRATKNVYEGAFAIPKAGMNLIDYLEKKKIIPQDEKHGWPTLPSTGITEEESNPIIQALPAFGGPAMKIAKELALSKHYAALPYRQSSRIAKERGVKNLKLQEHFFEDAANQLPNDFANKSLIDAARNGDYQALMTLSSDIGKAAQSKSWSLSGAERMQGRAAAKLKQNYLNALRQELENQGHPDMAKLIQKGNTLYKRNAKYTRPALAIGTTLALGAHPLSHIIESILKHG
jgi:hypothetical protein